MGAIGEPKREIHIPVTEPAPPVRQPGPRAGADDHPGPGGARARRRLTERRWASRGTCSRRRSRPASWPASAWNTTGSCSSPRSTGSSARRTAWSREATCPLDDHDAPAAECSCGFYAVADDTQLWRLGADEPELAVLDVELAGRVIEHDHGYRASDQRVTAGALPRHVRALRAAGRGVRPAPLRRVCVPACRRCARRAVEPTAVSETLGVPVTFTTDDPAPAPTRHPSEVRPRADHGARRDPAPHRRGRARHRIGHPARVRPAGDRRVAGHGAVVARTARRATRHRRHRSGAPATSVESGRRRGRDRM